jgi:hypothetical protein
LPFRKKTGDARLDFIWSDLDVLLTFATIAEAEYRMGNREHAERTLANAEKGYTDMLSYFAKATGLTSGIDPDFQSKFKQVRERLDGLRRFR